MDRTVYAAAFPAAAKAQLVEVLRADGQLQIVYTCRRQRICRILLDRAALDTVRMADGVAGDLCNLNDLLGA